MQAHQVHLRSSSLADRHGVPPFPSAQTGRLKVEITRLEKQQLEFRERLATLQKEIQTGQGKMNVFKTQMKWGQEELEQWAIAARQKEEDNEAIEKYAKQDEGRIKDLNLLVEKAAREISGLKESLENEVTDTQATQIQLDKAAEDFKSLHQARQEMVAQWEEKLETVKSRDEAIQKASETFAEKKGDLRRLKGEMDAQAKLLDMEVSNNRELDARIQLADREVTKLRDQQAAETQRASELQDELELVRNTLRKVGQSGSGASAAACRPWRDPGGSSPAIDVSAWCPLLRWRTSSTSGGPPTATSGQRSTRRRCSWRTPRSGCRCSGGGSRRSCRR